MKQYLELGERILNSTFKGAARENMPTTVSVFGHQMRFNLQEGFPIITTKEVDFRNIVVELLWFMRGKTNISYMVEKGVNIWNEDAYNYYIKLCRRDGITEALSFPNFVKHLKGEEDEFRGFLTLPKNYELGDTGKQYPWLWRNWGGKPIFGDSKGSEFSGQDHRFVVGQVTVDQLENLVNSLIETPNSRRHIISAWNPTTLNEMALPACHSFVQFNCRPIPWEVKLEMAKNHPDIPYENLYITEAASGTEIFGVKIPQYYLDCQLYQRSGDYFLGVPYNIASYALLTEVLAQLVGMIPGDFIHTFGDVHIYSDHIEGVQEQLTREPKTLPRLKMSDEVKIEIMNFRKGNILLNQFIQRMRPSDFTLDGYKHHTKIKGKLSTGLK